MGVLVGTATGFLGRIEEGGLAVVDETRFNQEYDIAIPLSFSPKHLWLVGGHLQLEPICSFDGVSKVSNQGKESLHRAYLGQDLEILTKLLLTFRMPVRLADLPGVVLGYSGLLIQDKSVHDSDEIWIKYGAWFEQSTFVAHRRARFDRSKNQTPEQTAIFQHLPQDARRLFINVRVQKLQGESEFESKGSTREAHLVKSIPIAHAEAAAKRDVATREALDEFAREVLENAMTSFHVLEAGLDAITT
ncbi:hypothetical protein G7Y89_g13560 [Cudoniella acicularis]|uniref:Uncharacterized protein n=1 Tax=Cudoniella acicularis TaxID=354080 RepID=A0A8H4RAF7_9HELO|nr:hypothetical protein G7Y89_g13560 [Cudoniella acicularis]